MASKTIVIQNVDSEQLEKARKSLKLKGTTIPNMVKLMIAAESDSLTKKE